MNASFNTNTSFADFTSLDFIKYPPQLRVAYIRVDSRRVSYCTFSSYIENHEIVYAVPRVLTVSVEWFRILNELSGYVWFALIVTSLLSASTLYLLANNAKDPVYIIMLTVQLLFGFSWGSDFLPLRGRVLFTIWLFLCCP